MNDQPIALHSLLKAESTVVRLIADVGKFLDVFPALRNLAMVMPEAFSRFFFYLLYKHTHTHTIKLLKYRPELSSTPKELNFKNPFDIVVYLCLFQLNLTARNYCNDCCPRRLVLKNG